MPSLLMADTPTTPEYLPSCVVSSWCPSFPAAATMMTPLVIALVTAHLSSLEESETLREIEMIWAPSSTAWLMRAAVVSSLSPLDSHEPFDVVSAVEAW